MTFESKPKRLLSKNSILTDLIVVEMEIFLEWVLYLVLALFIETNIM